MTMLASPIPVYLGCASLIVGCLGIGAHHLIGGNTVSNTEPPLFAQSVEEAALSSDPWASPGLGVAQYAPMVELLTMPQRSSVRAAQEQGRADHREAAQPEVVRDLSQQSTRRSRHASKMREREDVTASREQVDPRNARAQETQIQSHRSRRSERRYRTLDEADAAEVRGRSDRRRVEPGERDGDRRLVIREPEQRVVGGPEQRDTGFNPFRHLGGFD